jgi:hypothetical protein
MTFGILQQTDADRSVSDNSTTSPIPNGRYSDWPLISKSLGVENNINMAKRVSLLLSWIFNNCKGI